MIDNCTILFPFYFDFNNQTELSIKFMYFITILLILIFPMSFYFLLSFWLDRGWRESFFWVKIIWRHLWTPITWIKIKFNTNFFKTWWFILFFCILWGNCAFTLNYCKIKAELQVAKHFINQKKSPRCW